MHDINYYLCKINEWEDLKSRISLALNMCLECGTEQYNTYKQLDGLCVNFGPIDFGVIQSFEMKLEGIHDKLLSLLNDCDENISYYQGQYSFALNNKEND